MKDQSAQTDDYYVHLEEEDISSTWGSFELEPVVEDEQPSFADTLNEHNKIAAVPELVLVDSKNEQEIALKAMINRVTAEYKIRADENEVDLQVNVDPVRTAVDINKLEKVVVALLDELLAIGGMNSIVIGSRKEGSDYTIRISGFMWSKPEREPKSISASLQQKAASLGMTLCTHYRPKVKIAYDISMQRQD